MLLFYYTLVLSIMVQSQSVSRKRSPLELGYVSFSKIPAKTKHFLYEDDEIGKKAAAGELHPKNDVWVPGHVSHHAFIPAHHAIVPHASLVVATLLVRPSHAGGKYSLYEDDPFKATYGGFGVGIGAGGHGAGHGFQVVFS